MNHMPFIIAAYVIVLLGTGLMLAWSYAGMKRTEKKLENMNFDQKTRDNRT